MGGAAEGAPPRPAGNSEGWVVRSQRLGSRPQMDFRLLGPLEVAEHDQLLALGGVKQRSVLAVLLLQGNEVVSAERLIDELWGDAPPATAAKSIQVHVSNLRKELGNGRLATRAPGYVLHVDPSELDL